MNKLWTFGDSFTSNWIMKNLHDNQKKYLEMFGLETVRTWPMLLADRLGLEFMNKGKGGSSNYDIFQSFNDTCENIKEGDMVIIGWGLISKFRMSNNNSFMTIGPDVNNGLESVSLSTLKEVLQNRLRDEKKNSNRKDKWVHEIYYWENAIKTLAKHKKFDVYFWSSEEPRIFYCEDVEFKKNKNYILPESNTCLMTYLKNAGCPSMADETNNVIGDSHFGKLGHQKQAEIFYNFIKNGQK